MDFAGPFMGKVYLIVVDAMSKWVEVDIVKSMSSAEVIRSLRRMFAIYGIPDLIISDNGTAFKSAEIQEFYEKNAIQYTTSAPFHPSSNGQAERMVQFVKKSLSTLKEGDVELKLQRILFRQHTTVNTSTGKMPSELMMGRKLSQILDKIHPYNDRSNVQREADARNLRLMEEGESVFVRNYARGNKWLPGMVVEVTGPVSYVVQLEGGHTVRRHIDQMRRRELTDESDDLRQGIEADTGVQQPVQSNMYSVETQQGSNDIVEEPMSQSQLIETQ